MVPLLLMLAELMVITGQGSQNQSTMFPDASGSAPSARAR
jgi:hypothetical protein